MLPQKIADKIDASGDCWEWDGFVRSDGYARGFHNGRRDYVHRLIWEILVGPIPKGLDIDHLCRNRSCVNPDHLEPVTRGENLRRSHATIQAQETRRTHCPQGHAYSAANTYVSPGGSRRNCRTCKRERRRGAK